jgi:predicted Zn finger-like uncharacterized protein
MASARLTCPDCKSVLRPAKPVPDGKKVKCPKCGNLFTTPGLRDDDERPRRNPASKKKQNAAIKKAVPSAPAPKRPDDDDEDEGGGIYGYVSDEVKNDENKPDITYAPDMSIKDLRGPAQEAVVSPSNWMLLIGGVCCLCNIFLICFCFWPMVFSESVVNWQDVLEKHFKQKEDKNAIQRVQGIKEYKDLKDKDLEIVQEAEHDAYIWRFEAMGGFIFLLIYNGIVIIGAVKMQNLESRRWGIAASVMTLLPMGAGGISALVGGIFSYTIGAWVLDDMNLPYSLGLSVLPYLCAVFVGVWGLRTLFSQEVIDGFEYVAE